MGNLKGNRLMLHYWIVLPKKNRALPPYSFGISRTIHTNSFIKVINNYKFYVL